MLPATSVPSFRVDIGSSDSAQFRVEVAVNTAYNAGRVTMVAADQAYYWSPAWQREEQRALKEIATGDYQTFDSVEDAIAFLDGE